MITKEELLQKGIDPEKADMIIAALEGQKDDSSPLALLKAEMSGGSEELLFKAKGEGKGDGDGDNDDDDADYDEEYMRKYMKKYMKANKKEASSAAKEVGLFAEKMEKAINDIPSDAECTHPGQGQEGWQDQVVSHRRDNPQPLHRHARHHKTVVVII